MALRFLNGEVSDLCLGKPELKWVAATDTISDAVSALNSAVEPYISVWVCGGDNTTNGPCVCVGKFCMADVVLFLCREDNLADPFKALEAPVSDILPKGFPVVRHLDPNSSVLEAIDCILEGTQNLVIPILDRHNNNNSRKRFLNKLPSSGCDRHNGHECCWLTREDVLRFLLNSVGAFSPVPTFTIQSLNIIDRDVMTITYDKPASSALGYFNCALIEQTSVAVVDEENRLIGDISSSTLAYCDESAASAIMALSAMDLMTYIDCGGPPENLVQLVKMRLEERNLGALVDMMDEFSQAPMLLSSSSSCSSDDEFGTSRSRGSGRHNVGRRCEAIVCSAGSSLLAVMIQALAHRVSCVWVVEEDRTLVGMVTLAGILNVFRSVADGMYSKS